MLLDQYWTLHWDVRAEAAEVMKSMASAGHGDSVYLALEDVVQQSAGTSRRSSVSQDEAEAEAADEEDGGDPSAEDAGRVLYTTAELKDALRPTSSSQPTPAAVRGNAARRMALSQQAQTPVGLAPLQSHRHQLKHKQSNQKPTQEQGQMQGQEHRKTLSEMLAPLSTRPGTLSLSQFADNSTSPSPSTSASMSQLSSPTGSQQGDSVKKKYRHRKKKHRPVTSALHGKTAVSQTTKPKATPTSQHSQPSSVTMNADHSDDKHSDQAHLKPSLDMSSISARDMASPEVGEQQLSVEARTETQTQTSLQGSAEFVISRETEILVSSTRTVDAVLSPVQESYESGEDESDDSPTLPLPEPSATMEVISSEEKVMYPEIECGQRIPESQPVTLPESSSDALSASFEDQNHHFDSLEQTQELDFEEFASYNNSQGTPSPPPSSSPPLPSLPISPESPAIPINFKAGSPTLDLGSVSQQGVEEQSPVVASVSKEQSPLSDEESDELEVWHPSLQSVRSSNGSESPSESEPGPGSMVTLEYDNSDEAPVTQALSQRSESPAVTGTLFSLDKEQDTDERTSKDKEISSGVGISTRSLRTRSTSTPEATGVHIPTVIAARRGQDNENATDVAVKGRRLLRRQRTPEPVIEIKVPRGSQSLAFVNIPTATNTKNRDARNNHASLSRGQDDTDYTVPDKDDGENHHSSSESSDGSSDDHNSDIADEEDGEYGRGTRRMTRARMGRTSKRLEKQRNTSTYQIGGQALSGATGSSSNGQSFKAHQVFYEASIGTSSKPFSSISESAQDTKEYAAGNTNTGTQNGERDQESTHQEPVDGHGSASQEESDDTESSDDTPVLSRKRQRRAPPTSSSNSTSRARDTTKETSRVGNSLPSLRAATTPDLEMDQVIEDQPADLPEQGPDTTLQSEDSESDDEWDVRRLKRIWKKYNISWPLRDRRAESEAKQK
ncbi:hypothetical protein BGZ68_001970, partial [Mortierella alpina]